VQLIYMYIERPSVTLCPETELMKTVSDSL